MLAMSAKRRPDGAAALASKLAELGWTQTRLEQELNLPRGIVSRWLNRTRKPGVTNALLLESAIGIPAALWALPPSPAQKRRSRAKAVKEVKNGNG